MQEANVGLAHAKSEITAENKKMADKKNSTPVGKPVGKPVDDDDMQLQDLHSNFMNDAQVRDYYRKLVPNYTHKNSNENNKNYYPSQSASQSQSVVSDSSNQVLIEKLNYMINLLEEQQDQKTNSVTEEVVLYSFLGVFIIFVVDSFARVGKYTR